MRTAVQLSAVLQVCGQDHSRAHIVSKVGAAPRAIQRLQSSSVVTPIKPQMSCTSSTGLARLCMVPHVASGTTHTGAGHEQGPPVSAFLLDCSGGVAHQP